MATTIKRSVQTDYIKQYMVGYRKRVYAILGDKCIKCGETNPLVLTIDHIEPCGNQKTGTRKQTVSIYREILENPQEAINHYQLLCRNCNWLKMIQNNERQLVTQSFVYHWELDTLAVHIHKIERRLEQMQKGMTSRPDIKHIVESTELNEQEIESLVYQHKDEILNDKGHIDPKKIRLILWEKHRVKIGYNKAYTIKAALEFHHDNEFS